MGSDDVALYGESLSRDELRIRLLTGLTALAAGRQTAGCSAELFVREGVNYVPLST